VIDASKYFARQSFVDPERMAIFGQSRGGMVTLLAIGTNRSSSGRRWTWWAWRTS
jgi:dipeptidyl aminopeptidase/acylaminoacyl peptidase